MDAIIDQVIKVAFEKLAAEDEEDGEDERQQEIERNFINLIAAVSTAAVAVGPRYTIGLIRFLNNQIEIADDERIRILIVRILSPLVDMYRAHVDQEQFRLDHITNPEEYDGNDENLATMLHVSFEAVQNVNKPIDKKSIIALDELCSQTVVDAKEPCNDLKCFSCRHENCAICMDPMESGEQVFTFFCCNSRWHRECGIKWLETNNMCPNCRTSQGGEDDIMRHVAMRMIASIKQNKREGEDFGIRIFRHLEKMMEVNTKTGQPMMMDMSKALSRFSKVEYFKEVHEITGFKNHHDTKGVFLPQESHHLLAKFLHIYAKELKDKS
jgi:hypothetical protein